MSCDSMFSQVGRVFDIGYKRQFGENFKKTFMGTRKVLEKKWETSFWETTSHKSLGLEKVDLWLGRQKELSHIIQSFRFFVEKGKRNEQTNNQMKFKQKKWIEPYADLNTELKVQAGNE